LLLGNPAIAAKMPLLQHSGNRHIPSITKVED